MIGKTGRIQAGVMDCKVRGFPVKSKWYCSTAVIKVAATYIQNKIRDTVVSHVPVEGAPYSWMHDSKVAMERKKVGLQCKKNVKVQRTRFLLGIFSYMKRLSVGCWTEAVKVPGCKKKRIKMIPVSVRKRNISKMKTMVPMVVSPRKR